MATGQRQLLMCSSSSCSCHVCSTSDSKTLNLSSSKHAQQANSKPIPDDAGRPIPGTSLRVVDPESFQDVPDGQQGVILARGPGVMKGYYNDPQGTQKAFPDSGWFDTGDLGWRAPGMLLLRSSSSCLSPSFSKTGIVAAYCGNFARCCSGPISHSAAAAFTILMKKKDFTSCCQPTRLITCANHGNHVQIIMKSMMWHLCASILAITLHALHKPGTLMDVSKK